MQTATVIVTGLLAAVLTAAAARKLTHRPDVVRSYAVLGVPKDKLNALAAVLLAGAAGLLAGLWWAPVGVAAAIGVICYFAAAAAVHVRARETRTLPVPLTFGLLGVAALVLRLTTW